MDPTFFATAKAFRAWLKANHAKADELVVGFHKKHTGVPSITRSEAVDQALCFGWIDGVIRSLEGGRHSVRFTPRRKGSIWSAVNIKRVAELDELGLMTAAGRTVFDGRDPTKAKKYSFENRDRGLDADAEQALRANAQAWTFWEAQPPSYRRPAAWWVVSAVKPEPRAWRLGALIADSANGVRLRHLVSPKGKR